MTRRSPSLLLVAAALTAGCVPPPSASPKATEPATVTLPRRAGTRMAREDDVDAEKVTAACADIQREAHAALDALVARGVSAESVARAKEVIGACSRLSKGGVVLTIDDLAPALPPARDPICDDPSSATIHPSSLSPFGCMDEPCDDCVTGRLMLTWVAPPFGIARLPLRLLDSGPIRMRSSDDEEAVTVGLSLETIEHRVAAFFDADDDGWPELLDCGTIHTLSEREDAWKLSRTSCELFTTSSVAIAPSRMTQDTGLLTGELRTTPSGVELGVQTVDARDACKPQEINVTLPDAFCLGPRLWSRKVGGKFLPPLEDPSFRDRFTEQCALLGGPDSDEVFGEMPSGTMVAQVLCESLKKGEPPPPRLPREELVAFCGEAQDEGECRMGDVVQGIYADLREAVTRPSAK